MKTDSLTESTDKISVIIPCYNAGMYLEECIDSLLASTFPLSMLEFIFVDDASTDNTCEIIQKYEELYPDNILLIKCVENKKTGAARNIGMSYAAGNYIAFVDGDDKVYPEMFQEMYEKISLYKCDMAGCGYTMFNEAGIKTDFVSEDKLYLLTDPKERKKYILTHGHISFVWKNMFRKQFLDDNNIRFPEDIFVEDLYFYELCMMTAQSAYEIKKPLYYYRRHSRSTTDTEFQKNFISFFTVQDAVYREMTKRNLTEGFRLELALLYFEKAFVQPMLCMTNNADGMVRDEEIFQMIKKTILSHFPDILDNPYILSFTSETDRQYLDLLR